VSALETALDKLRKADLWRSWVGAIFLGGFGLLLLGLAFSESRWNGDITAAFVLGLICAALGAYFVYRVKKLGAIHAQVRALLARPSEIARIEVQTIPLNAYKTVWNIFVHPHGGKKLRMAVYRRELHDEVVPMLQQAAPAAFTAAS
jgi:hypothetical protein